LTTHSELAILSLLAEEPRHGYDIEQMIEQRGMRNWTEIGFSSIYYLLNKLEQSGKIHSRIEASRGKGPARKVYELTEAGQADWRKAVLAALALPEPCHLPIQIGLSNLPLIALDEAKSALGSYLMTLQARHAELANRQKNRGFPLPYQVNAMFNLSLAMIEAEINWLQSFILELDVLNK
jgi:DNA-binding PadR family transcriptional regulator